MTRALHVALAPVAGFAARAAARALRGDLGHHDRSLAGERSQLKGKDVGDDAGSEARLR
jgi:hypothetical protein